MCYTQSSTLGLSIDLASVQIEKTNQKKERVCQMKRITDEQLGRIYARANEVVRRVREGALDFDRTMDALQEIVEGKHEEQVKQKQQLVVCQILNSCQCSICGGFFGDSALDTICQSGQPTRPRISRSWLLSTNFLFPRPAM